MRVKRRSAIPRTIISTTSIKGHAVYATDEHNPRHARMNDDGAWVLGVAVRVGDRVVSFCWGETVSESAAIQWLAEEP
jgi:hypothetical protein